MLGFHELGGTGHAVHETFRYASTTLMIYLRGMHKCGEVASHSRGAIYWQLSLVMPEPWNHIV